MDAAAKTAAKPVQEKIPLVLVLDSDALFREDCRRHLMSCGFKAETAATASQGLEIAKALTPDLILLTNETEIDNASELLPLFLKNDPDAVIIVLASSPSFSQAVEAIKNGAFDYLAKPPRSQDLTGIVKKGWAEKKILEQKERERAEKRRLTDYFTSIVTHQLRTPLSAVLQYFEVLLGNMAGELTPEARQIISISNLRLKGLIDLIEDWLNYTKFYPERPKKEEPPIDAVKVIKGQLEFLSSLLSQKNIQAEVNVECASPLVKVTERSLNEVISNLISNGVKYNREAGKLTIQIALQDQKCIIRVSDTGLGIPPENLPFIFNEFYRVKNEATKDIPGTGLGLSIVKKIVEGYGGAISVESEAGQGSTFIVTLPAATTDSDTT